MTNFCDAITRMPSLKTLDVSFLSEEQTLTFTCEVIVLAVSQDKDVVVAKHSVGKGYRRLKIESKYSDGEKFRILSLRIEKSSETYLDADNAFVQKNFKNYCWTMRKNKMARRMHYLE